MTISSDEVELKQLTVRVPARLLEQARRLAKRRHTSVNGLVRSLLEDVARAEREQELARAYARLGEEAAGSDVESYFDAQAEVARRG